MKKTYIKPQTILVATQAEGYLMGGSGGEGGTDRNSYGVLGISNTIKYSNSGDWDKTKGQGQGGNRSKGSDAWNVWDE